MLKLALRGGEKELRGREPRNRSILALKHNIPHRQFEKFARGRYKKRIKRILTQY